MWLLSFENLAPTDCIEAISFQFILALLHNREALSTRDEINAIMIRLIPHKLKTDRRNIT